MFGQFSYKTAQSLKRLGVSLRVSLPRDVVGDTYRAARAIQTEDEKTQEYDAREFAAILAETLPPAGASCE